MRLVTLALCLLSSAALAQPGADTPYEEAWRSVCQGYTQADDYAGHPRISELRSIGYASARAYRQNPSAMPWERCQTADVLRRADQRQLKRSLDTPMPTPPR